MAESINNGKVSAENNNREIVEMLNIFCKSFVEFFKKKLSEIKEEATVGGTPKIGRKGNCIKRLVSIFGDSIATEIVSECVSLIATGHREKSKVVNDDLRQVSDNANFRKILVLASGEIFYCYQNQFILVTNAELSWQKGMEKLATDAVDRVINYISEEYDGNIDEKSFHEFITKGVVIGESKKREVKYNGHFTNTKKIYEGVGVVKIGNDNCAEYFLRKSSKGHTEVFGYRFQFLGETLYEFEEKTYRSRPIINRDLTKKELEEQLILILESINSEDLLWYSKETKKDTNNIMQKLNNVEAKVDQFAAKLEKCQNDQLTKNPIWFDMREPVTTFTGRTEVLKELHRTLQDVTGSAVISQTASVSGLGGIGKSELSRKYAFEYQDAYDGNLIWINSETQKSLIESFVRLAEKLNIPVKDRRSSLITEDIYKKFGDGRCLFIFDNAEEYEIIKEFLPVSLPSHIQKPHILITSRNQDWNLADTGVMCVINLAYFTSDEALDFIKNALEKNNSTDDEIKELAKELGYFPLALGQAVAYIKIKNERAKKFRGEIFSVSDYLKAYKDESLKAKLLEHRHKKSQYNKTVLTTWNITLKNIEEENKDSIKIIKIMAYLVPDSIDPDRIFSKLRIDEEKREDAIELLLKYSMINIKDRVLSIHRLVQEVIRLQIKDNSREKDVLVNALELLGYVLWTVDDIHLISIWRYACDYGKIIDEFFFKYKDDNDVNTTPFHLLVENGATYTVNKTLTYLKMQSNEKFQEILNSTKYPLYISDQNNLEMVKLLIKFGAEKETEASVYEIFIGSVDIVKHIYPNNDEFLLNAKFYSTFYSKNVENLNNLLKELTKEQIQNILERKLTNVDPELINSLPPLYIAAKRGNLDIVKLLINYGADVNISCIFGTPLHTAVVRGHFEVFKFLIDNGANCNAVNRFGDTVLHTATEDDRLEMLKYLINNNKCDLNATNADGETALHLANEYNRLEIAEYLRKIIKT